MPTGLQVKMRREPAAPASPPAVGLDEVVLDEKGRLQFKQQDGALHPVRTHKRLVGKFTQFGDATAPVGDVIENEFGGAPVWSRLAAGRYQLALAAGTFSEDFCVVFATLQGTSSARSIVAKGSDGQNIIVETYDGAGALAEGDCTFVLLVMNYAATV